MPRKLKMINNKQEIMNMTDEELEFEALMEEIGQKIEFFVSSENYELLFVEDINNKINRFVDLAVFAGNSEMGKAVKKRWRKIHKNQKLKK